MSAGFTKQFATGNGATLSFSGFSASIKSIGEIAQQGGAIEDSVLENEDFKSYMPSDLIDPGTCEVEIYFEDGSDFPDLHQVTTFTITFPSPAAGAGPQFVASGFLTKRTTPACENGKILSSKLTIQFDGKSVLPAMS